MSEETARESVEFALRESRDNPTRAHHVLRRRDADELQGAEVDHRLRAPARRRSRQGHRLQPDHQRHAAAARRHRVPRRRARRRDHLDRRPARRCRTSSASSTTARAATTIAAPKIKALLARHRSRPIGARVTLTQADARRQARSTTTSPRSMGFWEVGFAPVTTAPGRDYAIADGGFDHLLGAVPRSGRRVPRGGAAESPSRLLERPRDAAGDPSRARQGVSVRRRHRPDGRVHRRRRRALPSLCRLRRSQASAPCATAFDREKQQAFLDSRITSRARPTARTCWARPICAGGCYHEAHTRYGSTDAAQPALLRVDSRLDAHLPRDLRRDRRNESRLPAAVR